MLIWEDDSKGKNCEGIRSAKNKNQLYAYYHIFFAKLNCVVGQNSVTVTPLSEWRQTGS